MNAIRNAARRLQQGFTAIEMMVVLIVSVSAMALGGQWMSNYSDNMLNQAAADHAKSVADAATRYIKDNYSAVTAVATPTTPASITVAMLQSTNYLPASFAAKSPYGQSYSVLALEPVANQLQTLIVTSGGDTISELNLRRVAQLIGAKGGYVSSAATTNATGSYGGWTVPLASYGVSPGAGHVAVALFFQDGSLVSDYVYRNAVPGHPELNTMNTPLIMASVQTLGNACTTTASIAADSNGAVLSCQGGTWKTQGSAYWQDPVNNVAGLPTCNAAAAWQTRVVKTPTTGSGPRAYTCDGAAWQALGIDDSGNLTIPNNLTVGQTATINKLAGNLQITATAAEGAACTGEGRIASSTTNSGLILSCQSGRWTGQGIGSGQAWQDVTATRAKGVSYLNNTGRPIYLLVSVYVSSAGAQGQVFINGVGVSYANINSPNNVYLPMSAVVPPGALYAVTGTSIYKWFELR